MIKRTAGAALAFCALLFAAGCAPDMSRQPKYRGLRAGEIFADARSARPTIEGTVARGMLRADEAFYTGRSGGALVERAPVPVTPELVERGRDRFSIYCTPCHGRLGDGEGMVVMRGFQRPTSYHIDRLREAPDGHFFDVMTHGQGAMSSYAARIAASDRWAVAVYIRALQLSQSAGIDDVPPAEREKLTGPAK